MANHVASCLNFIRMNAKAKEKLAMILKWNEMQSGNGSLEQFHDIMEHAPEEPNYAWYHDHVGPKWCHFEDYDLDVIRCESAWGWPDKGYHWLIGELRWQVLPPSSGDWDGLSSFLPELVNIIPSGQQQYYQNWLSAMELMGAGQDMANV